MLFIINEKKRNLDAVSKQIKQYHNWLKEKGVTVHPTYLMYDAVLDGLIRNKISVLSKDFLETATVIS